MPDLQLYSEKEEGKLEKIKNNAIVRKIGFNRIVLFIVLLLLYVLFAILSPTFLSYSRILSALNYAYFLGFLALGVTFVIGTGGIDFSIGPVMFAAALIAGQLLTKNEVALPICLIVSVIVGLCFGVINGWLVSYRGLPSFITSMAIMMLAKGVGSVFTKIQAISWPQSSQPGGSYKNLVKLRLDSGFNLPTGLFILLIASVICAIVLNKTRAGRYILCIGDNREATRLSGVDVKKWEMLAYVISGTLAGVAAIFYVGAYTTVLPGMGDTFNNEAIASCVMGGTSMSGGVASIGGTLIGVMIVSLLQEGILAMGFQKDYQYVLTGILVVIAVYADIRSKQRKN
jgi:ribose transport system permease protein